MFQHLIGISSGPVAVSWDLLTASLSSSKLKGLLYSSLLEDLN